ncbi:MAG: DUF1425 domain-containing protein [Planctomycetes bacterium]|nr:DUF1425 domain-containing protein [Planctomycetota bacterium]
MRPLILLALACAGCADPPPPAGPDRTPDLALLGPGQPLLAGALEVTRFQPSRNSGRLALDVAVANRTGAPLRLRWRFRYVDAEGWERRTRDSAVWKEAVIEPGREWRWTGEAEAPDAVAAGMDWRYARPDE